MADLAALGSVWLGCAACAGVLSSSSYCCSMVEIAELPDNLFVVFFSVLSLETQLVSDKRRALPRRKVPAAPPDFLLLDLLLLLLRVLLSDISTPSCSCCCFESLFIWIVAVFLHHKPLKRLPMLQALPPGLTIMITFYKTRTRIQLDIWHALCSELRTQNSLHILDKAYADFVIKAINQREILLGQQSREQNREQNDIIRNEREWEPARISIRQILKMEFFRKPQNAIHNKRLSVYK